MNRRFPASAWCAAATARAVPAVLSLAVASLVAACGGTAPRVDAPTMALGEADRFQAAPAGAPSPLPEDLHWWHRFDDPALAYWVERALAGNTDILIARERTAQARALLRQAGAERGVFASLQVQAGLGSRSVEGGAGSRKPRAALALGWEADLWGGLRLAERSAAADVMREQDLGQAARLSAAGLAARAVIEWRAAGADAALLRDALALQHQVLDVAQVRVDAGLSPQLDVDRARAEVASVEAEAARAAARIPLAFAALQVLAGARPTPRAAHAGDQRASLAAADEGVEAAAAVPLLRGDLPVTRPIDLLRMRPDLRAAEHALLGAAANIGVARRALLPSLRLPGTIGLISGEGVLDVLSASIAAVIDQAIYDGGLRAAGVDAAEAQAREAALVYRQTLLDALRQVESAFLAARGARQEIAALKTGLSAAEAAVEQARTLYGAGLSSLLDLLDARRTALAQRRQLLNAQADAARQAVTGFEAMGLIGDS